MSEWHRFRRTNVAEMRDYIPGEVLGDNVSISVADVVSGSPKEGDMIARNPQNRDDQWLVAEEYFIDNFERID